MLIAAYANRKALIIKITLLGKREDYKRYFTLDFFADFCATQFSLTLD